MATLASASIVLTPTFSAKLEVADQSIKTWVNENYATEEAVNNKWSNFEETYEAFTFSINSSVQSLNTNLNNETQKRERYLRLDDDGLWIGLNTSPTQLLETENSISFVRNGDKNNPPMKLTDDQIYIAKARILKTLQLGNLTIEVLEDNSIVGR